jgi:hypothetical protein
MSGIETPTSATTCAPADGLGTDVDPLDSLHRVEMTVCRGCLDGVGAECHAPGCVFILHDTPSFPGYPGKTLRGLLTYQGRVDGETVEPQP